MSRNFKDLIAWQKAYSLCLDIFKVTQGFPKEEQYGLAAHLRKTAVSVPSNIAEGHERRNPNELNNYIRIALGSLAELDTQISLAGDLGFLDKETFAKLSAEINEAMKILHGLRKSVLK